MKTDKLTIILGVISIALVFLGLKGFIFSFTCAVLTLILSSKNSSLYSKRVSRMLASVSIIVLCIMFVYVQFIVVV